MSRKAVLLVLGILTIAAAFMLVGIRHLSSAGRGRIPGVDGIDAAESAYRQRDWPAAERIARDILKVAGDDMSARHLLARSIARQGRSESAEAIYRRLGAEHLDAEDYFLVGSGLMRRGQTELGLKSLSAARDLAPDHAETLNALSAYWAGGRLQSAAIDAADRLRLQPGWEVVGSVRLARLLADQFAPGAAADLLVAALARDASLEDADLNPSQARNLLVRCYLAAGRPKEAATLLQHWIAQSADPEAFWLLSRAQLHQGQPAEARRSLDRAASFEATDPMTVQPAPYAGAASCESCHVKKYRSQQSSPHSQTLMKTAALATLPWPEAVLPDDDNPQASHQFRRVQNHVQVTTTVGSSLFSAIIQYAMGSNHQGQSYLARDGDAGMRELRVSRYPREPQWARTMEHPATLPEASDYLGRPLSPDAFRGCLNCHSTNFRSVVEPGGRPESLDRGIGCERCHGPGGTHVAAIQWKFPDVAIQRPRLATAAQVVALCGECHRAPSTSKVEDARAIRYQAPAVMASRCYTESDGRFSCVSCHDPHEPAQRSAAFYEKVCLECHQTATKTDSRESLPDQHDGRPCPVNPRADCLGCHMPRIANAIPRTTFTDHRIRVRRDNGPASGH